MSAEASTEPAPRQGEAPLRWQGFTLVALCATILLAAFPYFERVRNANELPRLVQAMSLVETGEWAIDGPSRRGIPLGPDLARSPADERLYPNKPPGASVVGAAAYSVARLGSEPPTLRTFTWWARLFAGVLPVLVVVGVAWRRLQGRYGGSVSAAAILLWLLATPTFSYARLFYGHALAACLLYLGVVLLSRSRAEDQAREPLHAVLGGALAAAAITVEYGAAFAGLPIAVMLMWPLFSRARSPQQRRGAAKRAIAGLAGALIPVVLLARYHRAVFGSPWSTGYHHAADPGFAALHGQGLLGLGAPRWDNVLTHILSPNTGLLVWSPVVVFGCLGLIRLARRTGPEREAARVQLGIFALILVMGLGLSFQGGWRVGPRYLVVALPMLISGFAESIAHYRDHPRVAVAGVGMGLLAATAGASLVANALAATLWPHLDPTNIAEPFGAVLLPLWRGGFAPHGFPSMVAHGTGICMVLSVLSGGATLLWAGAIRRPRVTALPILLGFAFGVACVVIVVPRTTVAHPKTDRNLAYIESVYAGEASPSLVLEPLEP